MRGMTQCDHSPAPQDGEIVYPVQFVGSAAEYFRIWAANLMLTVLTMGIYSAWAKVRNKRYFCASTFIDDANFDYHANPLAILFARIILLLLIIGGSYYAGEDLIRNASYSTLLVLLLPWALVRGLAFNARNTSYRAARFSFAKTYRTMYWIYAPIIFGVIVSGFALLFIPDSSHDFGWQVVAVFIGPWLPTILLFPFMVRAYHQTKAENHAFGALKFSFSPPPIYQYFTAIWQVIMIALLLLSIPSMLFSVIFSEEGMGNLADNDLWFWYRAAQTFSSVSIVFLMLVILSAPAIIGAAFFRLFWDNVHFHGGRTHCRFSLLTYALSIQTVNLLASIFSFGLLIPWAKIRRAKFLAGQMALITEPGVMDAIATVRKDEEGAIGEELTSIEGFDFDVGLI